MGPRPEFWDWFTYFPGHYRWSAALDLVLGTAPYGGAELGEVDAAGRRLRHQVGDDEAWFDAWRDLGDDLRRRAEAAESAGHGLTASARYLRACSYYQIGERFRLPKDPAALDAYRSSLLCFERFGALSDGPTIERVEIPYGDAALPGYLVVPRGAAERPRPCVVFFDGLDVTKELQYLRGVTELCRRGISCLLVDGPGNGESIRFRQMPLVADFERAGSAAVDFLEDRPEVDADRIGIMAISLGGYYASRCASLDHRYRACVAWGAIWDYRAVWQRRIDASFHSAMSVAGDHISWVLGASSLEDALDRLGDFVLDGVVQRMRCPFLLLHGAEDAQILLEDAEALFGAVGSSDKTMAVFDAASGGATHCQTDQLTSATEHLSDWLADRLVGRP